MLKIAENNQHTLEWANLVGRFFQNFGMVELVTIEFVIRMAENKDQEKKLKRLMLKPRLQWISENILKVNPKQPKLGNELIGIIEIALKLADFRNIVAHSAIGLTFPEDDQQKPPSIIGLMNFRPVDKSKDAELISIEEMKGRLTESATLGKRILDVLNKMDAAEDSGGEWKIG